MGATSATKLLEIVKNTETVVAIELMSARKRSISFIPCSPAKVWKLRIARFEKNFIRGSGPHFCSRHRAALALVRSRDLIRAAEEASGPLHGI